MSVILITPAVYLCDACGADQDGTTARLPAGWVEHLTAERLEHRCPECAEVMQ